MIAILAWGFFSAVTGAARNKRIDRIRRDLMNNLTHELKTPISTIGLASEALKDPDMQKDPESFNYYIGLIHEENKRLAAGGKCPAGQFGRIRQNAAPHADPQCA